MAVSFLQNAGAQAAGSRNLRPRNKVERALARFLIGTGAVEQAFRQMSILLKGDVPAVAALETCAELARGSDLKAALREAAESVRGGSSLAKALRAALPWAGDVYAGLVEVGEANGSLPQMFGYATDIMRQRREIRSQVKRAMAYPAVVVAMGLAVGYYVATVAIPKIVSVMGDPEKLPAVTRSLVDVSGWLQANGVWLLVAPVAAIAGWMALRRTPGVGVWADRFALRVPIFGKVGLFAANSLFNRTLSTLVASGIGVVEGLGLVGGVVSNGWYRRNLAAAREKVVAGRMFSDALAETAIAKLSPMTPALARVGESTGSLDEGLLYAGEYYAEALQRRLDVLGKLVEPALIVTVGAMVAYVYIAFFMGMAAMSAGAR